jgi:lipopolysaccharide export system permease protein
MLRILRFYFLREHAWPFFLAFFVINAFFTLNLLFRELGKFLSKDIALTVILEYLFLNMAWMIALSVPMAVLSASIMAFGRLSAENEITALKVSGINLYRIVFYLVMISVILAAGLIWFNNHVLPDFNHKARLLGLDIARKKPMIDLEPGVIYKGIPKYSILVERVEERSSPVPFSPVKKSLLENIVIYDQTDPNLNKTITAKRGEVIFDEKTGMLEFSLYDGQAHEIDLQNAESFRKMVFPEKLLIRIPFSEMLLQRSQTGYRGDREKSAEQLLISVKENQQKITEKQQQINRKLSEYLDQKLDDDAAAAGSLQNLIQRQRQFLRQLKTDVNMIKSYTRTRNMNLVEVHKKYSIPVACVVFVIIGTPLGIMTKKRGWAVAAALSIGFFLLYWAFLIGGEVLADRQIISPFLAMWSPNILVGLAGVVLCIKIVGETNLRFWKYRI